ncbi:MAG TPA: hypothetical protein VKA34_12515 [Balneolales bacterium]|nr:hypothetical protein [Balneolales bacterium]
MDDKALKSGHLRVSFRELCLLAISTTPNDVIPRFDGESRQHSEVLANQTFSV